MNRSKHIHISTLSILIFLLFCADALAYNALQQKKPDLFVVGAENCPYNCDSFIDKSAPVTTKQAIDPFHSHVTIGHGYVIEILHKIFEDLREVDSQKIVYKTMSQERAERRVKAGAYAILLGVVKDKENSDKYIFPQESIGVMQESFFMRADLNWKYNSEKSLQQVTLGASNSYKSHQFAKYISKNKESDTRIQLVSGDYAIDMNMRKLAKARIDVIFENKYTINYHRKIMGLEYNVIEATNNGKGIYAPKDLYIAFSAAKDDAESYAKQFDEGIRALRKSGELDKIMHRYGLEDWKR